MRGASPRKGRGSVAQRLMLLFMAWSASVICGLGLVLFLALERNLQTEDAEFLSDKVHVLRAILQEKHTLLPALREEVEWESAARRFERYFARVVDAEGKVVIETPGMDQALVGARFPAPISAEREPGEPLEWRSASGQGYQLMAAEAQVRRDPHSGPWLLQVALDTSGEDGLISYYRSLLVASLSVALAVLAIGTMLIIRRGLAPIGRMAALAEGITASRLHARIGSSEWPRELAALAASFDEMLNRLEDAFGRLTQFSADIAHELRTPLHNLVGEAEVALAHPREAADYRQVLESGLEEMGRLSRLIDSLLFLASSERGEARVPKPPTDLRVACEAVVDFHRAESEEAGVELRCQGEATAPVNPDLFRRAVSNLLSNALRHTPSGGSVRVELAAVPAGGARVSVRDTGDGIPPEHLPRVFDRFYRVDFARSTGAGGFGLGLAIVKSIMELHGGSADITSEPGRGTVVTLRFPG